MNSHFDLQKHLESVVLVPRLRAAASGKSASQGGLNMPDMKNYIETQKHLYHDGPMKKPFPDLTLMKRSDLETLLKEILDFKDAQAEAKAKASAEATAKAKLTTVSTVQSSQGATAVPMSPVLPAKTEETAAARPATPPTAQKAGLVTRKIDKRLEVVLKEINVDLETLKNAANGLSQSRGGLNMPEIKYILEHFKLDSSGLRASLNSKLLDLLTSLEV